MPKDFFLKHFQKTDFKLNQILFNMFKYCFLNVKCSKGNIKTNWNSYLILLIPQTKPHCYKLTYVFESLYILINVLPFKGTVDVTSSDIHNRIVFFSLKTVFLANISLILVLKQKCTSHANRN